jgi:uncharacterized membrane protein (DUF373 family)
MNTAFSSEPIDLREWGLIICASLVVYIVIEFGKWIRRCSLVLIGIELLETMVKTHQSRSIDRVKIVMAVAIIAIARKVIILDMKELPGVAVLGIAAIILALSIGYYLIKRKVSPTGSDAKEDG